MPESIDFIKTISRKHHDVMRLVGQKLVKIYMHLGADRQSAEKLAGKTIEISKSAESVNGIEGHIFSLLKRNGIYDVLSALKGGVSC